MVKLQIDENEVIDLYLKNGPIIELQKKFNIDKSRIYKILKKHNIQKNKFKPEKLQREDDIIKDYKNGMITRDILNKYQIKDPASLYCILNKRKVQKKFEEKRDIDFNLILKLYNEGNSPKEIGAIVSRSRGLIRKLLVENNVKLRENGYFKNQNKDKIIKEYDSNLCFTDIAKKFNCSDVCARNIVKEDKGKIRKYSGSMVKNWNGGITEENKYVRKNLLNKKWIKLQLKKNNYKSEISFSGGKLRCHHIYPFKAIIKSSIAKHKILDRQLRKLAISNDCRLYDETNGLILTKNEHDLIEKSSFDCHPCWKIWKLFPEFALKKFSFIKDQYLSFNENGKLGTQDAKIYSSGITEEIKRIIRYEHYLGTIPPHKLILTAQINGIIAGIATFGQGANKNMSKDCWELTRLCVPYYVVRPFTIKFLNMCIDYIKANYPEIKQLISYVDPNVGHDGAVYRMSGWKKEGKTKPSYAYFDPETNQLRHKSYCRRINGLNKSEKELSNERGLIKIDLLPKRKYSKELCISILGG